MEHFKANQEQIKDAISRLGWRQKNLLVDDLPYIIGLGMDLALDLHKEYGAVLELYQYIKGILETYFMVGH